MHEGVDRQQLDRRDAEVDQVVDDRRPAQRADLAAHLLRDLGMAHRIAARVHLVDHGLVPGPRLRALAAPGEGRVDDHALRHVAGAVAPVEREVAVGMADPVAEQRVMPLERPRQGLGVGIDQQLVRVEAVAVPRIVRSVDAIAVELPRPHVGQVAVPDLMGHLAQGHAMQLAPAAVVEQAQLDLLRNGRRREAKLVPGAVPGRAGRIGGSGQDGAARRGMADLRRTGERRRARVGERGAQDRAHRGHGRVRPVGCLASRWVGPRAEPRKGDGGLGLGSGLGGGPRAASPSPAGRRPGASDSMTSPPWARIRVRATARPSPVPPVSRLREASKPDERLERPFPVQGGMPGPSSIDIRRTDSAVASRLSRARSP